MLCLLFALFSHTCEMERDYYQILNVPPTSTHEEIKSSRLSALREARGNEQRTAEINDAFSILGNEAERRRYDAFGHADLTPIRPKLFLGGESAAQRPSVLASLGITHVLSCAHSMQHLNGGLVRHGLVHKQQLEVEDTDEQDLRPFLEEAFLFIESARQAGGILVHCQFGISRSPSFVAFYLMRTESISFDDALEQLQSLRPKVNPGEGFRRQLRSLNCSTEQNFPASSSSGSEL